MDAPTDFTERLWPSPGFWLVVPVLGAMVGVSLAPLGVALALVGALVACVLAVAGLVVASPRVVVTGGHLMAGRARVPLDVLGHPRSFCGEEARQERGPRLDARAFLVLRGWVGPVVRVPLRDPGDPTPYWLVSTRRPAELVAALAGPADDDRGGRSGT